MLFGLSDMPLHHLDFGFTCHHTVFNILGMKLVGSRGELSSAFYASNAWPQYVELIYLP